MKLFFGSASPFVRKVMVAAIETKLEGRLELKKLGPLSAAKPTPELAAVNPLAKIPTLVLDDGRTIVDSRVICEYLDSLHDGPKLFPAIGEARWRALTRAAWADGLLEAAIAARIERSRAAELQSPDWIAGQMGKATRTLDVLEHQTEKAGLPNGLAGPASIDVGDVGVGCALGFLDFRMPDLAWRQARPALARWFGELSQRRSMRLTVPADPSV